MSRARHRLTRIRQAIVNVPSDPPGKDGFFDAFFDADTYSRHVAGDIDGGLPGANNHSGTTSDAYLAALRITELENTDDGDYVYIGSANVWGGMRKDITDGVTDEFDWPFEFNPSGESSGQDGWIASQSRRGYYYCNLNDYGPPLAPGDIVKNAVMVLTVADDYGFNANDWIGVRDENTGAPLDFPVLTTVKDYCAYKVLQGITPGNFDKINWWGFTGGDSPAAYWDQAGGSNVGVDIDDFGVDHCASYGIITPSAEVGKPDPGSGTSDPTFSNRLGNDQGYRTIRINITDYVQDAVDNESGTLKIAVYRNLDTSLSSQSYYGIEGSSPGIPFQLDYYPNWTNMIRVISTNYTVPPDEPDQIFLKPRIEISYIKKT